jgi:hypothetical protein
MRRVAHQAASGRHLRVTAPESRTAIAALRQSLRSLTADDGIR